MTQLPASIEAYLREAGFASTEILILKRLLTDDALTLRKLAAKTGKSTGVLDTALKKLVTKGIVHREDINETSKFAIASLKPVMDWMDADMKEKRESLIRKHKDFESFIHSVSIDKKRPEMHYYEGLEGIQQAYLKLLNLVPRESVGRDGKTGEMLHYLPVMTTAEEDPLRDFRVEFFRERRRRGIFTRTVAHDTALGKRYQTRDPFEYRKTILVDEVQYPFTFEKIIVGDTVACINHDEKRACFLDFPDMAKSERTMFEKLWSKKTTPPHPSPSPISSPNPSPINLSTRTLSGLREFFLGRRSIATFVCFGILAAGLTYALYQQNISLNTKRIREKAVSIAATGALQFEAADLEKLHTADDMQRPEWAKVIYKLNEIRRQNEDIKFIYIMRSTADPKIYEFVADADSLDPSAKKDLNFDGVIDDADSLSPPGDPYDISKYPNGVDEVLSTGVAGSGEIYTDPWGTFITAFSPIRDTNGNVVAALGVDIVASKVYDFTRDTFAPLLTFLGFFLLFVIIRLVAFNRSLYQELSEVLRVRRFVATISVCAGVAIVCTVVLYFYNVQLTIQRIRERVTSIAATGALQFTAEELQVIHALEDTAKPEYKTVVQKLQDIRKQNSEIVYTYIIRPTKDPNKATFVADADGEDPFAQLDTNFDGVHDEADTIGVPGLEYDMTGKDAFVNKLYTKPIANERLYTDQWGTFFTGYAPIRDSQGNIGALLAVDMWGRKVYELTNATFAPIYIFLIFFVLFLLLRASAFKKSLLHETLRILNIRSVLVSLASLAILSLGITYGIYRYTVHIMYIEIANKLMAIAATSALQIDVKDLENLRFARDMQRPEYQKVFNQLNTIRNNNENITYLYIMRPTDEKDTFEFVVDADSNEFIPFLTDTNQDGILNEADEGVTPGVRYVSPGAKETLRKALREPIGDPSPSFDQWGTFISSYAPIKNPEGKTVAILEVDVFLSNTRKQIQKKFTPWLWFTGILVILASGRIVYAAFRRSPLL